MVLQWHLVPAPDSSATRRQASVQHSLPHSSQARLLPRLPHSHSSSNTTGALAKATCNSPSHRQILPSQRLPIVQRALVVARHLNSEYSPSRVLNRHLLPPLKLLSHHRRHIGPSLLTRDKPVCPSASDPRLRTPAVPLRSTASPPHRRSPCLVCISAVYMSVMGWRSPRLFISASRLWIYMALVWRGSIASLGH
jgi:hypothetical protein